MDELYNILESYNQKNDPRFIYDGLYEEPADTSINLDPMYNMGSRQFGDIRAGFPRQGIFNTAQANNIISSQPQFEFLPEAYNQSEDVEQVDSLTGEKKFNVLDLLSNFIPGRGIGNFLARILPQDSPEVRATKNFYARNYGVTPSGSVASGIMQGYNPVSGGFLNMITGGRYGKPMQVGLANAARQRIENIVNRRAPQTDASRAKIQELQKFAEADTINRARTTASDVYRDAGNRGALGPGGGFSTSGREGAFESKSGRGRRDF
jgi:hypothetical protein